MQVEGSLKAAMKKLGEILELRAINAGLNVRYARPMAVRLLERHRRNTISKNGFWFVDIPKTSSTAVKIVLENKYGVIYGNRHNSPWIMGAHSTAARVRSYLGSEIWEKIFTFSLVRNPWDRLVSLYLKHVIKNTHIATFKEYIREIDSQHTNRESKLGWFGSYLSNCGYLTDNNGNIIVDYVGKFENRDADLEYIGKKINCELRHGHVNSTDARKGRHYSEFYDDEMVEMVRSAYAEDIEMFGYEFEKK